MRILVQRVTEASVTIEGKVHGSIGQGLAVLVGVTHDDTMEDVNFLADKAVHLRIFEDAAGKMNLALPDVHGEMLIISQFTLYGNAAHGRRPEFLAAARPDAAIPLYEAFIAAVKAAGIPVATGVFGADMQFRLCNDGPVTLMIDSKLR